VLARDRSLLARATIIKESLSLPHYVGFHTHDLSGTAMRNMGLFHHGNIKGIP
jgi:hypothetical protein